MDYLLLGIVCITLFFSLRTNYKLSNFEEEQRKVNRQNKDEMGKILSKLHSQIDSVEKKMTVLHKSMNDFKDNNDKSESKNLNALKKQIAAVKNDTDLIKSLYLKPDKKGEDKTSLS